MAFSKVILNGDTLMDVTSDTVTADKMLSGTKATKNDGTKATGSIATKSSTDLTASGATVTAPAGYYASSASKSVATTTHPNPTASVNSSTGVVTASHTQGTGYVTGGTTTGTLNLTTQAAKTVTPSTSSQTAVAAGRYTTGAVTVAAMPSGSVTSPTSISGTSAAVSTGTNTLTLSKTVSVTPRVTTAGYISSGTAGNSSVSLTASVTTKSAATITPGTANQTIASGTYLTGAQTISGDSNLVAENIAEGVSIFGVTGTHYGGDTCTITITGEGNANNRVNFTYKGVTHYALNDSIDVPTGATISIDVSYGSSNYIYENGKQIAAGAQYLVNYYTVNSDIEIKFTVDSSVSKAEIATDIQPLTITESGTYTASGFVRGYSPIVVKGAKHTATLITNGTYDFRTPLFNYVQYNNTSYYTEGDTFEFSAGDILTFELQPYFSGTMTVKEGDTVLHTKTGSSTSYDYTLPDSDIALSFTNQTLAEIFLIAPTEFDVTHITVTNNWSTSGYILGFTASAQNSGALGEKMEIPADGVAHLVNIMLISPQYDDWKCILHFIADRSNDDLFDIRPADTSDSSVWNKFVSLGFTFFGDAAMQSVALREPINLVIGHPLM